MEITPLPKDINDELVESYSGLFDGYLQVGPQKWILPDLYQTYANSLRNFKVEQSDVWIFGVPRSGTTMTQDIVWLLTHNLDFKKAKEENSYNRCLLFETEALDSHRRLEFDNVFMDAFESYYETGDHRVIKSHLPFCLCPPDLLTSGAKIIYVLRYAKDVVKSLYGLETTLGFKYSFEKFWDYFENNLIYYNPYWEHVKQGLEQMNNKNVLIVCYEDVIENPYREITRISKFLDKDFSEQDIKSIMDFVNFDTFKKSFNTTTPEFSNLMGKRDSWKKYFTGDLNRRADKWIEENGKKIEFWNKKYGHY